MRADARCARVQALARAAALTPAAELHLVECEPCREIAGQYRWLAAELRAVLTSTVAADDALVASIGRGVDQQVRRLRVTRALATVAGGLVVAGVATLAGVATTVARRDRVLAGA